MKRLRRVPDRAGFSLIELLAVMVIIVILTVLSAGTFSGSAKNRKLAQCQKNLQKIYVALNLYRSDNGAYPVAANAATSEPPLSGLIPKDTTDTAVFICPSSGDDALPEGQRFDQRRISYAYYMGWTTNDDAGQIIVTDWQVDTNPKKQGQLVFSADGKKPGNNHGADGGNLLSCGGDVSHSKPQAARDLDFPSTVRLLNP